MLVCVLPLHALTLRAQHVPSKKSNAASLSALARRIAEPLPVRNLYRLANQLRLRPPRHIPHVIRTTSPNYPVGHEDSLYILSEDTNHYYKIRARIVAESPHLYLYVQDGQKIDTAAAQHVVTHFESSIYRTDRSFFGSEWIPGIDGDPHITCLVADLRSSGVGGYFSAEDEFPTQVYRYSNQREMIYMNSVATMPGDSTFADILSHEFQHMIHEHMHPSDNAWLNEGMSMLAEQVNGYPPQAEPSAFIDQPDTQLNSWSLSNRLYAHYGAAYLFLSYINDHFGRGMIHALVAQSHYTDLELVNAVLQQRHIHLTANEIFKRWVIANLVHDRSIKGGIYGYTRTNYVVKAMQGQVSSGHAFTGKVPPYAAQYVDVGVPATAGKITLRFSAPATVPVVSASGAPYWWSDRGDMAETALERTVDLTHLHTATMRFRAWYDLETNYDFTFLEASTDGGKTWTTLPATGTTTNNETGANYGHGYTGSSKGWHMESVDLSRFAGHRVALRFQTVTDDEYNGEGMLVKDISIPALSSHASLNGWSGKGWQLLPVDAIPSHWSVQIVAYNKSGVTVSSMPLTGSMSGSFTLHPKQQGLTRVVAVVYTTAPKTTVPSTYTLSASGASASASTR